MVPNCTVVTALYNLYKYHKKSVSSETCVDRINVVLELPVYLVIFTEKEFIDILTTRRREYGFSSITLIIERKFEDLPKYNYLEQIKKNRSIYFPTRDERTSAESHLLTCSKPDFILETMRLDPFHTTKFAWLDALLGINDKMRICENYTIDKFLNVLNTITDKFHIQILNVNNKSFKLDENKKDYYATYKYVVCGGFFTCGIIIGQQILNRVNENFIKTTELGFGHGEEMLFLEILDEFYDNIEKGYGDYGQIINNILFPVCNLDYIYSCILQRYLDLSYHKESYDCSKKLLYSIENLKSNCAPNLYMNILFSHYIATFYYKNEEAFDVIKHIYNVCNENNELKQAFNQNKGFYESQFRYLEKYNPTLFNRYKLVINVFACATIEKYKNEILKINETWGKRCEELSVKVLFFLGEEITEFVGENYIYLKNVDNSYESASYKQSLGLRYIYENMHADYIYTCGTDTYLNVDKLVEFLETIDKTKELYIGGHGDVRKVGNKNIYFHSGGAGFVFSHPALQKIYKTTHEEWKKICVDMNADYLIPACDVFIGYKSQQYNFDIIKNDFFYGCNYMGHVNQYKCCVDKISIKDIISCHNMTLKDFDEYTLLLQNNNYYKASC